MTKNIKNVLIAITVALLFVGCGDDDNFNRETGNYIHFSLAGSLMDGVYRIEENLDYDNEDDPGFSQGMVTGMVIPDLEAGINLVTLGFTDSSQNLSVTLMFTGRTGLFELGSDDMALSLSITDQNTNNIGDDYTILVSKSVSLNVQELEMTNLGFISTVKRAKGHFNGVMTYVNVATGEEYSHTITGDFLVNKFF